MTQAEKPLKAVRSGAVGLEPLAEACTPGRKSCRTLDIEPPLREIDDGDSAGVSGLA